jgi:hypothetical protein
VFVRSVSATGAKRKISIADGSRPRWRLDGKELFFVAAGGKLMAVLLEADSATLRPGIPQELFQIAGGAFAGVSPNGQRFLVSIAEEPGPTSSIVLVSNWPAAMKP